MRIVAPLQKKTTNLYNKQCHILHFKVSPTPTGRVFFFKFCLLGTSMYTQNPLPEIETKKKFKNQKKGFLVFLYKQYDPQPEIFIPLGSWSLRKMINRYTDRRMEISTYKVNPLRGWFSENFNCDNIFDTFKKIFPNTYHSNILYINHVSF